MVSLHHKKTTKALVYLAVLLDVISIGIYIPALEKLVDRYHVSPAMIGLGLSAYSLCAFFATPLLGQLSDRHGRKRLLIYCIFGTALSYFMLLGHHSFALFILSRVINGVTGGNFSILQATIADISSDDLDRKKNFGLLGALFGLGFIIGPIVGSLVLSFGHVETIFWVGGILALVDALLMIGLLPETHTSRNREMAISLSSLKIIRRYLQNRNISHYLWSILLIGVGMFSYQSVLSIETKLVYGVGGEYFGYILAATGIVTAINMSVILPKFWLPRFSTWQLTKVAHSSYVILLSGLIINSLFTTSYFWVFVLGLMIAPLFGSLFGPVYQGEIIAHSNKSKTGELTGVMSSLQTISMVVGPIIGGVLLDLHLPLFSFALLCVLISFVVMKKHSLVVSL